MDRFSWHGFLFAPISLSESLREKINCSPKWRPWQERFPGQEAEQIEDMRKFLIAPIREKIFPLCESSPCSRKTLVMERVEGGLPWFPERNGQLATIQWVDLLILDTFSLLIFKLSADQQQDQQLGTEDLYSLNRKLPAWFKRHPGDDIAHWRTAETDKTTLKDWVEKKLFGFSEKEGGEAFGDTDWFGHSLPMASFVGSPNQSEVIPDEHFINLLVGAPHGNRTYDLCAAEIQRVSTEHVFQVYNNWLLGDLNNRILFYAAKEGSRSLIINIEKHYIYALASVFYQKIMLIHFLEEFIKTKIYDKNKKSLRYSIVQFRKQYSFGKISTYYIGEKIYEFFMKIDNIGEINDKITKEISKSDDYENINLRRKEGNYLFFFASFAAILLPVSTVGTIFSVQEKYLFVFPSKFWTSTLALTAVFIVWLIWLKFFLRKQK
ncbi:hypothetical protein [Geoalkalibacter halelectricus]|uniref:hypothetical protein n=1 Tax=Geoalkalibacter halelectricus TaxID=2847045 RepID=UPI003D194E8E